MRQRSEADRADYVMSVMVPKGWADELQRVALAWGIPRSELVRTAVDRYVTWLRRKRNRIRR